MKIKSKKWVKSGSKSGVKMDEKESLLKKQIGLI